MDKQLDLLEVPYRHVCCECGAWSGAELTFPFVAEVKLRLNLSMTTPSPFEGFCYFDSSGRGCKHICGPEAGKTCKNWLPATRENCAAMRERYKNTFPLDYCADCGELTHPWYLDCTTRCPKCSEAYAKYLKEEGE